MLFQYLLLFEPTIWVENRQPEIGVKSLIWIEDDCEGISEGVLRWKIKGKISNKYNECLYHHFWGGHKFDTASTQFWSFICVSSSSITSKCVLIFYWSVIFCPTKITYKFAGIVNPFYERIHISFAISTSQWSIFAHVYNLQFWDNLLVLDV